MKADGKTARSVEKKIPARVLPASAGRDLHALLSELPANLPELSTKIHMGHTSFTVGNKVFAFTRNDGVAMKLPRAHAELLVNESRAVFLVMGKRTMKEWVVIRHATVNAYRKDLDLFQAAIEFVFLPKPSSRRRTNIA